MSPSGPVSTNVLVDQLRKVLLLEKKKGFADTAVVGGLDKFLARWGPDAHRSEPHPMFRATLKRLDLTTPGYAAKSQGRRVAWIDRALEWAEGVLSQGLGPDMSASDAPASSPVAPPTLADVRTKSKPQPQRPAGRRLLKAGQGLDTALEQISGMQSFFLTRLQRMGIDAVRDLLFHFPRRHIDFSRTVPIAELEPGQDQTIVGTVWETSERGFGPRRRAAQAVVGDDTGNVRVIWWNQPYVARSLKQGTRIAISGRVSEFRGRVVFDNPEYEVADERELVHTARLVPIYPLTEGLTSRRVRTLIKRAVDEAAGLLTDFVPQKRRKRLGLMGLADAVREAHFPTSEESKEAARRRLAFDELLLIQLGVMERKRTWKEEMPGHPLRADPGLLKAVIDQFPFSLTGAQRRTIDEVVADLGKSSPMSRLVQGDVGSGKTVVALIAMLLAAANSQQVAFMVPTEVLAEQHFRTIRHLLGDMAKPGPIPNFLSLDLPSLHRPVTAALLTGSLTRKRKQEIHELVAQSEIDILVGTHALFQKDVDFVNLTLVIVDEQHRFGVMQRSELRQKGYNPHLLVMTATPIPRTLALTLYGDLDISVIDEMPAGRQLIQTSWIGAQRRSTAYEFMRRQVAEGRQCFIIYPLIEESEKLQAAAAQQDYERLSSQVFPELRVGLLHGRLKAAEKDRVMRSFQAGDLDILVSTAVVEVGIDVPNATVMAIESAERFGLSQLHQFRGRVGRGEHQSYCILISESESEEAHERLRIMEETQDGFVLAEEDLRLRGPGEFFGTKQSGLPDLRMARLSDVAILEEARSEATSIFEEDPMLEAPEHQALAAAVQQAWAHRTLAPGEA